MWQLFTIHENITAKASEPMGYSEALALYEKLALLYPKTRVVIRKVVV
jgi:hypothetical protein